MRTGIALLLVLLIVFVTISPLQPNVFLRDVEVNAALEHDMPVVFVDPLNITASVGESFTIGVKVFNLSGNFHPSEYLWEEGEPLPPLATGSWRYNYSLGYLYGLDLRLSWDPTILDYVSHTVMVPVDDHPGGILNGPDIFMVADNVNATAGTYTLSAACAAPDPSFNLPDDNATAFTMTFVVMAVGACDINFTNVDLPVDLVGLGWPFGVWAEIPHWTKNGYVQAAGGPPNFESVGYVGTSPSPYVPSDFIRPCEPVAVNVNITGQGGVAGAVLSYRVDGGSWWNTTITYNATTGFWTAVIPGQLRDTIVEFFVKATDNYGGVATSSSFWYIVHALYVGDVDGDGDVDIFDIVKAAINYGKTLP